jgi:hypothetical protein
MPTLEEMTGVAPDKQVLDRANESRAVPEPTPLESQEALRLRAEYESIMANPHVARLRKEASAKSGVPSI